MKEIYNMLKKENIQIISKVKDWREAIHGSSAAISKRWVL